MMKQLLLTAALALTGAACFAQENLYLIKGNQVVAKYDANDVEYISFEKPNNVEEYELGIQAVEAGKNFVTYKVTPSGPSTGYVHCLVSENLFDYYLQYYFGKTLEQASDDEKGQIALACLQTFGFSGTGEQTYTQKHGDIDSQGYIIEVLAGQRYMLIVADLVNSSTLSEDYVLSYVNTLEPGQSPAKLEVTYAGLNAEGQATFNFDISDDVECVYTLYGYKDALDPYIEEYGFDYPMFLFGQYWDDPSELLDSTNGWTVEDESDYSFYAVGIDANGDWVQASLDQHIAPAASATSAPKRLSGKHMFSSKPVLGGHIKPLAMPLLRKLQAK